MQLVSLTDRYMYGVKLLPPATPPARHDDRMFCKYSAGILWLQEDMTPALLPRNQQPNLGRAFDKQHWFGYSTSKLLQFLLHHTINQSGLKMWATESFYDQKIIRANVMIKVKKCISIFIRKGGKA